MIPLLLVWLRAAGLGGQALALGGAAFALVVLRPSPKGMPEDAVGRTLGFAALGAALAALAEIAQLVALAADLTDDAGWPVADVLGSTVGLTGLARLAVALLGVAAALALRRSPASRPRRAALLAAAATLCVTGAAASHASGRIGARGWLVAVGAVHQAAASIWVGGLLCAALLVVRAAPGARDDWLGRFSALAVAAVVTLTLTGAALSWEYVATPEAAVGTAYGAMILTKIVLFAGLLAMGALNHRALHRRLVLRPWNALRSAGPGGPVSSASVSRPLVFRRRLEVEAGLALVTLSLAAAIASAPPAADVGADRATPREVLHIFTPQWPRLHGPSLAELAAASALGDPLAPRTPEDTAWSEFGHHVAGLFILAMGLLALLERTGRAPWARHWPLLFVGLTAFVAWSLDPEGWQTGLVGFWQQLLSAEVLEHRVFLALTALLGVAEWRVHSGRHPDSAWRYVFPLVCIISGSLLLSHAHDVSNAKSGFLMEVTHLPLGLVILVAGLARWLELRLPAAEAGGPGRWWAPALAVFGLLLLLYREV